MRQLVRDEDLIGRSMFTTTLGLLVEPFHHGDISPRARIGVGRLWNKDLGTWFYGFGVRYRFGRHSLVMDVERWKLTMDASIQTRIFRSNGGLEVLSSEPLEETEKPYQIRVGWEIEIG